MTTHDVETVARDVHEGSVIREMIEREIEREREFRRMILNRG